MNTLSKWTPTEIANTRKLGERTSLLQRDVPTRAEDDLPLAYVDATILVSLLSTDDPTEALVPLSYLEGYPTVHGKGTPFWDRLDNENPKCYELFKSYRDMKYTRGTRSIAEVAALANLAPSLVQSISMVNHWSLRVRAYDLYQDQLLEARRRSEIKRMENKHAAKAEEIFDLCTQLLEQNKDALTPKDALGWIRVAIELHRLSLGLHPNRPEGNLEELGGFRPVTINQSFNLSDQIRSAEADQRTAYEILSILKQAGALEIDVAADTDLDTGGSDADSGR